jgi:hypothetical protein
MKIEYDLRFENDEIHNTWYSNNNKPMEGDFQVHMDHNVYTSLGKPPMIRVTVVPINED